MVSLKKNNEILSKTLITINKNKDIKQYSTSLF